MIKSSGKRLDGFFWFLAWSKLWDTGEEWRSPFLPKKSGSFKKNYGSFKKWTLKLSKVWKNLLEAKVLENGSNDFADFWHEVWGWYLKKTDRARFCPKNPVFQDLGLTVPKWPKNLFFEIWSIYIVIIYENEALGLEKNEKIFLDFFAIFGPPF